MDTYAWLPLLMKLLKSKAWSPSKSVLKKIAGTSTFLLHDDVHVSFPKKNRGLFRPGPNPRVERTAHSLVSWMTRALTSTPSFCKSLIVALQDSMEKTTRFFNPGNQKNSWKTKWRRCQTHQLELQNPNQHSFFFQITAETPFSFANRLVLA